jgi:hypothetical protein
MLTTDFVQLFKLVTDSVSNYLFAMFTILLLYSLLFALIKHITNCIVTVVLACRASITKKKTDDENI